ncbi:MAG: hypothetical protein H5U27_06970 [Methyloversatilis sp.]|nr:hypothetical protein [Methyloversatilis sp.]
MCSPHCVLFVVVVHATSAGKPWSLGGFCKKPVAGQFARQCRDGLEQIGHQTVVGDAEDGRVGILVIATTMKPVAGLAGKSVVADKRTATDAATE